MENEIQELEIDKRQMNDNYFKNAFFSNFKLNIIIIIISIILFIIEFFYRDPLFQYSLDFEKNWQENATKETITTFKIFTKIGGEYLMAVPVIIVLWFFTLIKSYVYLMGFIFCLQFHSMMKIWYGNKRPFWHIESLYKGICDGGFGNPSGHSISTTFLYLSLFIYYKQTKFLKDKLIVVIIILVFCLFWTVMILLSRLILGMHSVNQVIYGTSLGLIFCVLIFIVFKIHQIPVANYKRFFLVKKYDDLLDRVCEKKVAKYRRFNLDGLFGSITVLAMLGMYLGQIVFWYLIENKYKYNVMNSINNIKPIQDMNINEIKFSNDNKNNMNDINSNKNEILNDDSIDDLINHWNKNRIYICANFKNVLKVILTIIICAIPGILFVAIPSDSNVVVIFIFKIGIPMFTVPFLLYSFGFYYIIKVSCGSKELLMKRLEENKI